MSQTSLNRGSLHSCLKKVRKEKRYAEGRREEVRKGTQGTTERNRKVLDGHFVV